jgi:hypothetical protein
MNGVAAVLMLALVAAPSLDEIKKEPDLEKRCERALEAAESALKSSKALLAEGGSVDELQQRMEIVVGGVELSLQALHDTGKRPYKLERSYKRGELKTREMLKQLDSLVAAIAFDNRPPAEKARDRLLVLHEEYLLGAMSGK